MIVLVTLSLLSLTFEIKTHRIKELDDHEVAARATFKMAPDEFAHMSKRWNACIPRETKALGNEFPDDLRPLVFTDKESRDLNNCSRDHCAFNFSPEERDALSRIPAGPGRKTFLENAYLKRADFSQKVTRRPPQITASQNLFEGCSTSAEMSRLLENRPLKNESFRIATVQYHKRMRPTTRLTQTASWKEGSRLCIGEALVYSNHYDIDRVDLWSLEPGRLMFEMRHRIDLLNSWLRRLNKEKFRKEAESIVERQIKEAVECLKNKK